MDPRVDIRSKLIVNCPEIMQKAGMSQIDFGSIFLNPTAENYIAQGQNIADNILDITENPSGITTDSTIDAINSALQFIIKDLIDNITAYAQSLFNTYITPQFAVDLAKQYAQSTAIYTKQYLMTPAEILQELNTLTAEMISQNDKDQSNQKLLNTVSKAKDIFNSTVKGIKTIMDEIQPYTEEISKYMVYGPEYVTDELVALYEKYYNMGISYVDITIGQLNTLVDTTVDYLGLVSGMNAANAANNLIRNTLRNTLTDKKIAESKVKVKAMAAINKATMNLMGVLGG